MEDKQRIQSVRLIFKPEKRGRPRVYKTEEEKKEAIRATCRNTQRVYRRQRRLGVQCFKLCHSFTSEEISLEEFMEQYSILAL